MAWFGTLIMNIVYAGLILAAAIALGTAAKAWIVRMSREYDHIDETLFTFLGSLLRYAILGLAVVFILARFGIQTASLVAVIGAAGLAIGLALQGTLSNIAAGVMLVIFRPFKVGDYIEAAGEAGTVTSVTIFSTELTTPDNVQVILPNGAVFGSAIRNYSFHDTRRVDLVIGVGYGSDLKKTETLLSKLIKAEDRIHTDPEPFVKVTNLGDSSVDFTLRLWVDAGDYWDVKFTLTRQIKDALDKAKIEIPFPTRTIVSTG